MSYYDNRESVANIAIGLMDRGWNVYGYRADESDSMTDYFCPASWGGVAEKNGFVLLVNVYSTGDSGREITEQTYHADYDKIRKLEAMRDDSASTDNEKASCQHQIDRMMEKAKESEIVIEKYPTFKYANPKRNNWHIEKDGEIIAKGNGAFQCDGYLFGNYKEETMKKVNKFIDRIESYIDGSEQLERVIVKEVKKVTKPVEIIGRNVPQVGDVLSFDYHGHYWIVYSVNEERGTFSYELLGSAKRSYQRLKNGKRYYDYIDKFKNHHEAGRVKIHKLKEVEEITEKVTYKKTKRKQKAQNENLIEGKKVEQNINVDTNKESLNNNETQKSLEASYKLNEELNGIEISFSDKPSNEVRSQLKSYGFRWHSEKKIWFAKQTNNRLEFVKLLCGESDYSKSDNNSEQEKTLIENEVEEIGELVKENNAYNSVDSEWLEVNLQHFSTTTTIDDVLSAFDDVDMSENSVITEEDRKHCENMEREYKAAIKLMNDHIEEYQKVIEMQQFEFVDSHRNIYPIEDAIKNLNDKFIYRVCEYFIKKYGVKIDKYRLVEKYKNGTDLETLLNEILEQLDGLTFAELQDKQIKDVVKDDVNYSKVKLKGVNVTIGDFVTLDSISAKYSNRSELSYRSRDKVERLIKAIEHYNRIEFETLNELSKVINYQSDDNVFTTHELSLPRIKSIKFFKNGRVDIHFMSNEYAKEFYIDYLQK